MAGKKKEIKKVEYTLEQKRKMDLSLILDHFELIPEPTYKFNIGDRVCIGNLYDVYVCEVLYDGKIYRIDYTTINTNYGKEIRNEHQKIYVEWYRIRKYKKTTTIIN